MTKSSSWRNSPTFLWALLTLAVASVATRFWGLGYWPLDGDEIITSVRGGERLWGVASPAYYWLWAISTKIFGNDEYNAFAVRFPSAVFGALAIPVFALTWRRIVGDRAALLGACALLLCGWHVAHSQWGRYYAGVFFFASLSYYFYLCAIKDDSSRLLLASVIFGGIGALFHASAAAVPASCFVATLVLWTLGDRLGAPPMGRSVLRTHLILGVIGLVIGLPIVVWILRNWAVAGLEPLGAPLTLVRFVKYVEIPTLLLAFAGWLVVISVDRRLAIFIAVGIGLPLSLALGASRFIGIREDYLFFVVPLLMVAVGLFLDHATKSLIGAQRGAATASLLLIFFPTFISYYLERRSLDVRDVVEYVETQWRPGDQTLSFGGGFRFYAPESLNIIQPEALRPHNMRGRRAPMGGWNAVMGPVLEYRGRTWVIVRQAREPRYVELSVWLGEHAHLVWRKYATRLDEEVDGFEVWRIDPAPPAGP